MWFTRYNFNLWRDLNRYTENNKRAVVNLVNCGPFIKTNMTRCIHCGRCVRFLTEICNSTVLGILGRGNSMEIGTYISEFKDHPLSANIIDLCPVGASTSMPYSFNSRPWEIISYYNIDILDSICSSVRLDFHNIK